jgi:hypothetical protein
MRFPSLASARRHLQASQAVAAPANIGGRYCSFLALLQLATVGIKKAAKGDIAFFREILERVEGKSVQPISGPDGGAIPHTIEGIDEYIMELVRSVQDQAGASSDDGRGKDSTRSGSRSKTKGNAS